MNTAHWPAWARYLLAAAKWALLACAVIFALYISHQVFLPLLALVFPVLEATFYDFGVYGAYPTQHYASSYLEGPRAKHMRWDDQCDRGLVFLTPNGPSIERPGPMILDARGELVWMSDDFGPAANLKVQQYNGESFLTFWSGEKAATSGKGVYFMMDSTYQVVRMVTAAGDGLFGDLHEFKLTEQGTALLTIYNTTNADLSGMGMGRGADGWVIDNLFQEIDLETGELLFQWSALEHFDPVATYMTNPFGGYWESAPFDWYHINSVDKDSDGNYLISSRHFHHIVCISPEGETLWIIGGRDNEFRDLSGGEATSFRWQHDARWFSESDSILTLFDNQKAGPMHSDAPNSRAMFVQLDIPNRTAKLVRSMASLGGILASSQGSVQVLPEENGSTFVGWGSAAAYSEFSPEGDLMCETHLGASWFYWFERIKSYRTTKSFDWHAKPNYPPEVKMEDEILYVSWNGATEVAYWSLEMSSKTDVPVPFEDLRRLEDGEDDVSYDVIDVIPKTGFEGSFELPSLSATEKRIATYRVAALGPSHEILGYSDVLGYDDAAYQSSTIMVLFKLFLALGFIAGARLIFKYYRSGCSSRGRAASRDYGHSTLSPPAWMEWKPPSPWKQSDRSRVYEWVRVNWTSARFRPR